MIEKIDKYKLDEEAVMQPVLVEKITEDYAQAIELRDALEYEVDKLTAVLDGEIRRQAKERNEKISEKEIENTIMRNADYDVLYRDYLSAKAISLKLYGKQEAILQRKSMIEKLVEMYKANYFSNIQSKESSEIGKDRIRKEASGK